MGLIIDSSSFIQNIDIHFSYHIDVSIFFNKKKLKERKEKFIVVQSFPGSGISDQTRITESGSVTPRNHCVFL